LEFLTGEVSSANCVTSAGSDTRKGGIRWSAPERLKGGDIKPEVDVYSFGIVIWEFMAINKFYPKPEGDVPDPLPTPFDHIRHENRETEKKLIKQAIIEKQERPQLQPVSEADPSLLMLMKKCWHEDPAKRPKFKHVVCEMKSFLNKHNIKIPEDNKRSEPQRTNSENKTGPRTYGTQ
jgi:serine/threonine protein kinase